MFYRHFIKPILFLFDPEKVHDFFIQIGSFLGRFWITRKVIEKIYGYKGKNISKIVDGIKYKTPIILSAGFDYNGNLIQILPHLGFGGVEIGSVTAKPCAGNAKPRLKRLPKTRGIIVNKGLKNEGVEKIIEKLKKVKKDADFVVGISIAKTNNIDCASTKNAIEDYFYSFRRLNEENVGDYYTINISCPNAYGGETFTTPELLDQLLKKIKTIECKKPVYIKMPIFLNWNDTKKLLDKVVDHKISGVIFGNLNKNYNYIEKSERPQKYVGGISGKPCFKISNNLIEKTKKEYGEKLTIIGCGGIFSPEDALQKIELGSELIHLITGMIYNGPGLIKKICKKIAANDTFPQADLSQH